MIRALAAICLALGLGAAPSGAQPYRDWQLDCDPDGRCALVQQLVAPNGGVFLAELRFMPSSGGVILALRTPLGPFLPERPAALVGSASTLVFEWHSCDDRSCLALHRPDQATLDTLRRASRMTLAYRLAGSTEARRMDVSLMGVTAGLRALLP